MISTSENDDTVRRMPSYGHVSIFSAFTLLYPFLLAIRWPLTYTDFPILLQRLEIETNYVIKLYTLGQYGDMDLCRRTCMDNFHSLT